MSKRLLITNVRAVLPDRILDPGWVSVEEGRIAAVGSGTMRKGTRSSTLDGDGAYLLPGLVDIHCDAVEKEVEPRPGVLFPVELACREIERKFAASGIVTIFHSISFSAGEGVRSNELAAEIARQISGMGEGPHLINNLVHLRYEISNDDGLELVKTLLNEGCADLLSLMDHTPGQGQYRTVEQYYQYARKTYHLDELECASLVAQKVEARKNIKVEDLRMLADLAAQRGICIASHDDDTPERVEEMRALGVTLAEFPVNLITAQHARALGMHVCVGAPNLLRGGSHENNLSAREALQRGGAGILCSDYHPPSLLHAVFSLAADGFGLPPAVRLATLHPAAATGLAACLGSIETGKRADLIMVKLIRGCPVVFTVLSGGRAVARYGYNGAPALAEDITWL
ncbi:MAG TPA: alpha-D-ribose 1-methylphosphonate 5-triphosphate diphosphatase [Firmicutes bacterium]|nr:alpha-D-ribose 1-methylphosphonate 5-triphosphate diphosphatase [Bacillota bacterium]